MNTETPSFLLRISLNVLEHLGINLYSNAPAVLSEIVANAWDADASEVHINWNRQTGQIVIQDDGTGMTPTEINERFLTVGYRRRDGQPGVTEKKKRSPMGRKGIGKLSLFSIAKTVNIETIKDNQKSACRMRLDDIRKQIRKQGGNGTYKLETKSTDKIDFLTGTRITLSDLQRRQTIRTTAALKKRVARRFSIIGDIYEFKVFINDEEVLPADRDYYDKIQYLWTYGDQKDIEGLCSNLEKHEDRTNFVEDENLTITGWMATVNEVRHLKDEDGDNLNRIAIFVRGKLAQEDLLSDFSERGVYANYLIGELRVNDLDKYDGPGTNEDDDAATSSRQRIVEDDERYRKLREIIATELKHIQNKWSELRAKQGKKKALQIPEVKKWIEQLQPSIRKKASKWLGRLNRIRIDEVDEQKQLIKHAVLAFEFHRFNENLDRLEEIDDDNLEAALDIFTELDSLESNLYGQIVQQRIQVIRTLQDKIGENSLEKVIQKYLFNHLWLLDPSWERTKGTEVTESRVQTLFDEVDAALSDEEKNGRLDIMYRKTAKQHVIIELKRPERVVRILDVIREQIEKYYTGIRKILDRQQLSNEPIEIVLLLGEEPQEWQDEIRKDSAIGALKQYNARVVFYDQLLNDAFEAYKEYLQKRDDIDYLTTVIQAIDDYAPSSTAEIAD